MAQQLPDASVMIAQTRALRDQPGYPGKGPQRRHMPLRFRARDEQLAELLALALARLALRTGRTSARQRLRARLPPLLSPWMRRLPARARTTSCLAGPKPLIEQSRRLQPSLLHLRMIALLAHAGEDHMSVY